MGYTTADMINIISQYPAKHMNTKYVLELVKKFLESALVAIKKRYPERELSIKTKLLGLQL